MSEPIKKKKKKRLRGFAGVINNQLTPLNEIEYFREEFKEEDFKILLNAVEGRWAALIEVKGGEVKVDGLKNDPKENLKKKKLGWDGKLETTTPIFLQIAMGKLSLLGIIWKVITRKIKIKGVRNLLKLLKMFNILSHEEKKEE